jgi:transcriptional regulator with XRE-family HTH domain
VGTRLREGTPRALFPWPEDDHYASPIAEVKSFSAGRQFRRAIGETLRNARRQRGLTLREVAGISGSLFKPSALGGYERGERAISLERFCDLARIYGVPADRLLADAFNRVDPEGRVEIVVSVGELETLSGEEPRLAADLIERVISLRGGSRAEDSLTLRSGDLEELAMASRLSPGELVRRLGPAVRVRPPQQGS